MAIKLEGRDLVEGRRNLDILRAIPKMHQHAKVRIAGKTCTVDVQTANMLTTVHDALGPENQARFQGMLAHSASTFHRLVNFGWSQAKRS